MGWRIFAALNLSLWGRGALRALASGHLGDPFDIVGLAMGAIAALGLFIYGFRSPALLNHDFWGKFCNLFIVWSLLTVVLVLFRTRALLVSPGAYVGAVLVSLLILTYSYFQAVAIYRLSQPR